MMGTVIQYSSKLDRVKAYETDRRKHEIRLDGNESFFPMKEELVRELQSRIGRVEFNRYPDPESEELCRLYSEYCGVSRNNVMAGNGSDEIIQIIINGLLCKDDKILTFKPDFSMYRFYSSLMEANFIELPLDENMQIDIDRVIEEANTKQVKVVIFSNPNNPTGVIIPREEILKLVRNCRALIVVDEAYYEFYGDTLADCVEEYENLAVLRTSSKAIGLAAARLGFLIANKRLVSSLKKARPPYNVNSLSQVVGVLMLENREIIKSNIEGIVRGRQYLLQELKSIQAVSGEESFKVFPSEANFVYIKTRRAEEIYNKLLENGTSIRYYESGALRVTVGNPAENKSFILMLKRIIEV